MKSTLPGLHKYGKPLTVVQKAMRLHTFGGFSNSCGSPCSPQKPAKVQERKRNTLPSNHGTGTGVSVMGYVYYMWSLAVSNDAQLLG